MFNTTLLTSRFRGLHLLKKTFSYIDCAKYKNADERELFKVFKQVAGCLISNSLNTSCIVASSANLSFTQLQPACNFGLQTLEFIKSGVKNP